MAIRFQTDLKKLDLSDKNRLKKFIQTIFLTEGFICGEINFRFCDDDEMLIANRTFLNHDYYTDVITFPLLEKDGRIDADILISVETVWSNSEKILTSYNEELHRVIFHSILHLCGFGDKSKKQVTAMRKKENEYLNCYFNT